MAKRGAVETTGHVELVLDVFILAGWLVGFVSDNMLTTSGVVPPSDRGVSEKEGGNLPGHHTRSRAPVRGGHVMRRHSVISRTRTT